MQDSSQNSTYYEILGVAIDATADEIKAAYRKQAMRWHPDRNPDNKDRAEALFKMLAEAYRTLSDPVERTAYDRTIRADPAATSESPESDRMSSADAAAMFFEQVLDLALELRNRGFDSDRIYRMLIASDCPEGIARAVAKLAGKNEGAPREDSDGRSASTARARDDSPKNSEANKNVVYAGIWQRAKASLIDGGISFLISWVFGFLVGFVGALAGKNWESMESAIIFSGFIIGFMYFWIYEAVSHGATPGKRIVGLRVELKSGGYPIGFFRSLLRTVGRYIEIATMGLGLLVILVTNRRQTLHDLVSGTVVVDLRGREDQKALLTFSVFGALPLVGIFAAIGLPAYNDYKIRSRISEIIVASDPEMRTIANYMLANDSIPSSLAGLKVSDGIGKYVSNISIDAEGVVYLTLSSEAGGQVAGKRIKFIPRITPDSRIQWGCEFEEQRYAPAACNDKESNAAVKEFLKTRKATAQAADAARYDATVREIEAKYPELNPDSPRFSQSLVSRVRGAMTEYMNRGIDPNEALRRASSDVLGQR